MKVQTMLLCGMAGSVAANKAATTTLPCIVQNEAFLGNGLCNTDGRYNTRACNWDGGDCCEASCVSTDDFTCGFNPSQGNYIGFIYCEDETVCVVNDLEQLGNGYCNNGDYNTARCNWDGGDCCSSTCTSSASYTCGQDLSGNVRGYPTCQDSSVCLADTSKVGNGNCDNFGEFNTAACAWDGGDCCVGSCVESAPYTCVTVNNPSICLDPSYQPVPSPPAVLENCTASNLAIYANVHCDASLNNENCNWDGGDCCPQTCDNENQSPFTSCGEQSEFDCADPAVVATFPAGCFVSTPSYLGDGYCDGEVSDGYNNAACNWDNGDCCSDTCVDTDAYGCGQKAYYNCIDQDSENFMDCPTGSPVYRSIPQNGICDDTGASYAVRLNTEACNWDGGDCCPSTCSAPNCTNAYFNCIDPDATDTGTSSTCDVEFSSYLGDGACDDDDGDYNTEKCGWDGGDCCPSTCKSYRAINSYTCGLRPFHCLDPNATENSDYAGTCQATPISSVGDGYCDSDDLYFNSARCGYDGGDCCAATCVAKSPWTCGFKTVAGEYVYVGYPDCSDPLNQPNTTMGTRPAVTGVSAVTTGNPLFAPDNGAAAPGANVGAIVGGIIGALVVIAIVVVLVWIFVIKKNTRYVAQVDEPGHATTTGQVQMDFQGKQEPNAI